MLPGAVLKSDVNFWICRQKNCPFGSSLLPEAIGLGFPGNSRSRMDHSNNCVCFATIKLCFATIVFCNNQQPHVVYRNKQRGLPYYRDKTISKTETTTNNHKKN